MVRGKFRLKKVSQVEWSESARELEFVAVCNDGTDENIKFHRATPSGEIKMLVDNPTALETFVIGQCYYVDFSQVIKPVANSSV